MAGEQQSAREMADPFFEVLAPRLDGVEGKLSSRRVWEMLGLSDPSRRGQDHNMRISAVMQALGWERPKSKVRFDGRPQLAWVKGEPQPGGTYSEAAPHEAEL
jgi:hypothetical protein